MVYIVVLAGSSFLVVGELNGLALVVLTLIKPIKGDGHHKQQNIFTPTCSAPHSTLSALSQGW